MRRSVAATAAATLIGFAVVALATSSYGPGIAPDSVTYLAAARSLVTSGHLRMPTGEPFTLWPPLFPAVLALGSAISGLDAEPVGRFLGALAHGALSGVAAWYLVRTVASYGIALGGSLAIALGFPLAYTASWIQSEPMFNLLTLMALVLMARTPAGEAGPRLRPALAALAAAAALTRYLGIILLVPLAIWVLLDLSVPVRRRLLRAAIMGVPTVVGLGAWSARNLALGTAAAGSRPSAHYTLVQNLAWGGRSVLAWFTDRENILPGVSTSGPSAVLAAIVVSLAVAGTAAYLARRRPAGLLSSLSATWPFGVWIAAYPLWLLVLLTFVLSIYGSVDLRLTTPAYAPLVITAAVILDGWRRAARSNVTRTVVISVVLVVAALPVLNMLGRMESLFETGVGGYSTGRWAEIELAGLLDPLPPARIYSDRPDAVYYLTERESGWAPRRDFPGVVVPVDELERWVSEVRSLGTAYLVWFGDGARPYFYPPDELGLHTRLARVARGRLVGVYRVTEDDE